MIFRMQIVQEDVPPWTPTFCLKPNIDSEKNVWCFACISTIEKSKKRVCDIIMWYGYFLLHETEMIICIIS